MCITSNTSDTIGNMLSDGTWTYTWEHGRELATMSNGSTTWTYEYDANGMRTKRTNGTTTYEYVYNGSQLSKMKVTNFYNADYEYYFFYDANGTPMSFSFNGTMYYYITNLQGDVVKIINAAGQSAGEYNYDAWGRMIFFVMGDSAVTDWAYILLTNPLTYRGYVFDQETGMYYLQSRYYDPEIGRFINADAYVSTDDGLLDSNMFAYCGNNPVMGYDPTGEVDWGTFFEGASLLSIGITACVVAVAAVSGGACVPLLLLAGTTFVAGGMTVANGAAEVIESTTGSNFMRDNVCGGDEAYYETQKAIFATVAEAGTALLAASSGSSNLCFVAGTMILVAEGAKAIETVKVGDQVWAWDEETGDIALKSVVETYVNETDELVRVFVNGEEIITTPSHPFYSPVKGWTAAVHLRAGDILVLVNGEHVVVEKVQHEILEAPVTVYNFQVEDYHTYYVADAGVLVHNACDKPTAPKEIGKRYIDSNDIDAHAFKQQAGGVPRSQISRYDIYQDTADNHTLWVGKKDGRDWRKTIYVFSDLVEKWVK